MCSKPFSPSSFCKHCRNSKINRSFYNGISSLCQKIIPCLLFFSFFFVSTRYHMHMILTLFCIGVLVSFLCVWGSLWFFPKIGLLDFPHRYNLSRPPIPYPGGIILLVLSLLFCIIFPIFWWLIPFLIVLGGISFWDDRTPLPALFRLCIHIALAIGLFWVGVRIQFIGNPFSDGDSLHIMQWPIIALGATVVWVIMIQNALNWFDGLPGLSVGISSIGFTTLGIFGLIRPELQWETNLPSFLLITFYLAGITLGAFLFFLRGKIILGDTGSQILGFLLAVFSLFAGTKIAVTLFVLCLPIIDSIFIVIRRISIDKKSPFSGDLFHMHHNFARLLGPQKTTVLFLIVSSFFGGSVLFLEGFTKIITLIGITTCVLFLNIYALKKAYSMSKGASIK